jgi:DNA-binding CsgD family transcriptional regulator
LAPIHNDFNFEGLLPVRRGLLESLDVIDHLEYGLKQLGVAVTQEGWKRAEHVIHGIGPINLATENKFDFTPREGQVLGLMATGLSNREIARQLYISELTVKSQLASVFKKMEVKNRVEAGRKADENNLQATAGVIDTSHVVRVFRQNPQLKLWTETHEERKVAPIGAYREAAAALMIVSARLLRLADIADKT